jgi:hypothetical protein
MKVQNVQAVQPLRSVQRVERRELLKQVERLQVRSLEKYLAKLLDVLGVAVAPARVGGKKLVPSYLSFKLLLATFATREELTPA